MKKMSKILSVVFALALILSLCSVGFSASADATIPESGYAAVGFVDATAGKAEVLLGTGEQGSVKYTGTAPTAGGVYRYTRDAENIYTFTLPVANGNAVDQSANITNIFTGNGFSIYGPQGTSASSGGWCWSNGVDTNPQHSYAGSPAVPVFFRNSATEWAVAGVGTLTEPTGGLANFGYYLDTAVVEGVVYYSALLFGNADANGFYASPNVSALTGAPSTYKNLAALTTDLHDYSTGNGGNGGNDFNEIPPVPESGYAAVGYVDTAASKVEVLLDTGLRGTLMYTGTAPTAGFVYKYTRGGNNRYTFTLPTSNAHMPIPTEQLVGTYMYGPATFNSTDGYGYMWTTDGISNTHMFVYNAYLPVFVRGAAENEWSVVAFKELVNATNTAHSTASFLDAASLGGDFSGDGSTDYQCYALVLLNADTGLTGLPTIYTILSDLTMDLHDYSANEGGNQGGNEGGNQGGNEGGNGGGEEEAPVTEVGKGYAAVGAVEDGKAEVLLGDGRTGTVTITGELTPEVGLVYAYVEYSDGTMAFAEVTVNFGNTTQLQDPWVFNNNADGTFIDGMGANWLPEEDTPYFIRHSATEWSVLTSASAVAGIFNGYAIDATQAVEGDNTNYVFGAMIVGNYANGAITGLDATNKAAFGITGGGINLGSISGNTLGGSVDTGDHSAAPVAIVVAISAIAMLGALCLIERKKVLSK